jgi:nicotinamidase-related amidase
VSDRYTGPDFASAALITIDVQRDTLDGGPLEVPGTSAALAAMAVVVNAFREAGRPIVHVVRLYESDGSNVDLCRRSAVEDGAGYLSPGAPGSQIAGELLQPVAAPLDYELLLAGGIQNIDNDEVVIYKPRWGAFYHTPVESHLRERQVSTVVFCGCNYPNCPRASMYEASERDFRVVLVRDAVSGLYDRGAQELSGIGVTVMSSCELVEALAVPADGRRSGS